MRVLATALLVAASLHSFAAERGFPLIETFEQRRHGAGTQIFDLTQSADGMLWFGGLNGVTTYDGAWWRTTALPNNSAVFAIESGRGPEIAVGAVDEFGWVAPDATGSTAFHSLRPYLTAEQQNFGDVRAICTTGSGFLFVAEHFAFAWSGGAPVVAADLRAHPDSLPRCFRNGGTTYVAAHDRLLRYDEATKKLVAAGIEGRKVDAVLPFGTVIRGEGISGASAELNEWLRGKTVTATAILQNDRVVIGTRQDGIAIVNRDGTIEQRLDTSAGLPGHVLTGAIVDREGALWLSYYGVIARLDLHSPVTLIDSRSGLRGLMNSVERHRGRLYVASSHGLFASDERGAMHLVPGMPDSVWHVLSLGDELLVSTREGVFVLHGDAAPQRIAGTNTLTPYDATRSKRDASRVWLSTKKGVGSLRRGSSGWTFEGLLDGTPPHVHGVVELGEELWASSVFDGAARITFTGGKPRVERFGSGERWTAVIDGSIAIVSPKGEISQPGPGTTLIPHAQLGRVRGGQFFIIDQDAHGNVWINSDPPQVVRRDGEIIRLGGIPPTVQSIEADGDVVWLIAADSIYRWDATAPPAEMAQPAPMIRRAVTGDDQFVTAPLPPAFGRLRIDFAPATYRAGVVYQYRLDPIDQEWSAWTPQPSIDYTNLDHGNYTFRVRARGASGRVSEETRWPFSVRPPWYRTRSALVLWLVAGAILIAAIVRLRTNALRRQAERLRAIVEERTEALRDANAHLERLSLLDELTGIANRRYFQRALVEDWRAAHEQHQPLALIIFDLDHFKQLNDQHGHAAGDAALVQVARHLARRSRRSGDFTTRTNELVARIGGEEFALILRDTTEAEAAVVAEGLREGMARLPIALTGRTVHVTMSAGVASMVPLETDGWSALMREADRALYDAKAEGRNRVRAASNVRARTDSADSVTAI